MTSGRSLKTARRIAPYIRQILLSFRILRHLYQYSSQLMLPDIARLLACGQNTGRETVRQSPVRKMPPIHHGTVGLARPGEAMYSLHRPFCMRYIQALLVRAQPSD